MTNPASSRAARVVVFLIQLYRHTVSPLRLPTCRFAPTCSQYAVEALSEYGLWRGGWLALVRLVKCGPWHPGGWDPITDRGDGPAEGVEVLGGQSAPVTGELWGSPAERGESKARV